MSKAQLFKVMRLGIDEILDDIFREEQMLENQRTAIGEMKDALDKLENKQKPKDTPCGADTV
jgi:hypothetical protein